MNNFGTIAESFKAVKDDIQSYQGVPADTRLLGRLEQVEESERGNRELLEKISNQMASLLFACPSGHHPATANSEVSLVQRVEALETKNEELQRKIQDVRNEERKKV